MTINNLLPGSFDTDRLRGPTRARAKAQGKPIDERAGRRRAPSIPAGRFGTAGEFGALCAFLCSAHAGYMVGQNLLIDGGTLSGDILMNQRLETRD